MNSIENDASNFSIVAHAFVTAATVLPIGDTHTDTEADGRDL
jgi:hypothetical protein